MATTYKRASERTRPGARWSIAFTDEAGRRRTKRAYCDKRASETLARKLEDEAKAIRDGLIDVGAERRAEAARAPIEGHIDDYRRALDEKGDASEHVKQTIAYVRAAADTLKWRTLADVRAEPVSAWLADLRDTRGLGPRTLNARRTALKGFTRWLIRHNRLAADPLAAVPAMKQSADVRRKRRPLTSDELDALIDTAEAGPTRAGISGADRAMFYRLLAGSGLRRSEAASLTPERFDLNSDAPTVTVQAAYSKRRREDEQPIPEPLAAILRLWLAGKPRGRRLWPLPSKAYQRTLRPDLLAAGIDPIDDLGQVVDFHSFRHGFITAVVSSGAAVSVAQRLARHSTPTLTLGVYAHVALSDERSALAKAFGATPAPAETLRMTGTDGAGADPAGSKAQRSAQRAQCPAGRSPATSYNTDPGGKLSTLSMEDAQKPRVSQAARDVMQGDSSTCASENESTGEGTRTPNLLIRSQVLYPVELRPQKGDVRLSRPPAPGKTGRDGTGRIHHPSRRRESA